MPGLWRNNDDSREGKYLVVRRDGTIPQWPWFVIGAADPAAPAALLAYADAAEAEGMDAEYVADIRTLAAQFDEWRARAAQVNMIGDPDAVKHRKDDPVVIEWMRKGRLTHGRVF
jgi:hypothetical protein